MLTITAYDLLAENVSRRAAQVALVDRGREITYAELEERVRDVAAWFADRGIARGDRVGIHLHKSPEEIVATFAAWRIGGVAVNINHQWTLRQLDYVVRDCQVCALVTDARRASNYLSTGIPDHLRHLLVLGEGPNGARTTPWDRLPARAAVCEPPSIDVDLAAILYTSGSTGGPKGVMLTHRNLIDGARSVARYLENDQHDRILSVLPLSFDYGLNQLTTMFLMGGALVLQPVIMPAELVRTIRDQRVTGMAAVPPIWNPLIRYLGDEPQSLPSLRYVTNSGGSIPPRILQAMPRVLPGVKIFLMYGLTEAFRSTYLPPEWFQTKMGSIGRAIPNVEVFVVDAERGLCGLGEQGELLHRGSLISAGYWGQPAATAEKIKACPHLKDRIGDEKVVFSGDIVRIDEDGFYWFVGRRDEMIKCSGHRISPTEVEDVVYESGLVSEVVAFGVADDSLGQVVQVAVSPLGTAGLDEAALGVYCRKNLPRPMWPRRVHLWPGPMPRTASGKLDRPAVIQACRGNQAAEKFLIAVPESACPQPMDLPLVAPSPS